MLNIFFYFVIKGVVVNLMLGLVGLFVEYQICVNVVLFGLIWMLFIFVGMVVEEVEQFGVQMLFGCFGQLVELVLVYVMLVLDSVSYIFGVLLIIFGGVVIL